MVSRSIKIKTVAFSLVLILTSELLGVWVARQSIMPPLVLIGLLRIIQIVALSWIVVVQEEGLCAIAWEPISWAPGWKKGALWSLGFGALTVLAMVGIHTTGQDPFQMIKAPLPSNPWEIVLFFIVGGFIGPVAEELCFRGIIYTFFRRWGILIALIASTAIFVALHSIKGVPLVPMIGGIVFAIAYEISDNLMVPITIHCTGNLAIFSLSLLP